MEYQEFLNQRTHLKNGSGFTPLYIPNFLFDFQKELTSWAIETGRGALFEDCGLGKTPQFLVWAENVVRHTNKPVLVLTPLSVAYQVEREGVKFDIDCTHSRDGKRKSDIVVTNYEKLHFFNWQDFGGLVCDESGILKNFKGKIKSEIINFVKKIPYRLLTTATAAPNDYDELGNSSEALGTMGYMDMLNHFFKNDQNNSKVGRHYGKVVKYRFKKHGEKHFWRFVSSWARAIRKPSDVGFDNNGFDLPELIENQIMIKATTPPPGEMFVRPAIGWKEQRHELKETVEERCEMVNGLVRDGRPFVAWCDTNAEGDLLEKKLKDIAVQVAGKHSDEQKEERFKAFQDGEVLGMITKGSIGGYGLNWQHCAHTTLFPSHSFEQYYQRVRRMYRFGQKENVQVDIITTPGMETVLNNMQSKSRQADKMFSEIIRFMKDPENIDTDYHFDKKITLPKFS